MDQCTPAQFSGGKLLTDTFCCRFLKSSTNLTILLQRVLWTLTSPSIPFSCLENVAWYDPRSWLWSDPVNSLQLCGVHLGNYRSWSMRLRICRHCLNPERWKMSYHNQLSAWYINIRFIRAPKCESPLEHTWWGLARILTGAFGRLYYVCWYSRMQSSWYVFLQGRIWQGSRGSENDGSRDSTSPTRGMETNA